MFKSIGELTEKVLAGVEARQHKYREGLPKKGSKDRVNAVCTILTFRSPDTSRGLVNRDGLRN